MRMLVLLFEIIRRGPFLTLKLPARDRLLPGRVRPGQPTFFNQFKGANDDRKPNC